MIKNCILEDIENKSKSLITNIKNKELYGEVYTPLYFVKKILDNIPDKIFKDPLLKWLDPGCGSGNFSIVLYFKLLD